MKKTYINPKTEVLNIELVQMVAASELLGFSNETTDDASDAESRRSNFTLWDDDEE